MLKMLKSIVKNGLFIWFFDVEKSKTGKIGALFNNLHRVFNIL